MEIQVFCSSLFFIWTQILLFGAFADVRHVKYVRHSKSENVNAIQCAAQISQNENAAARMTQDNSGQCQALTHDWILNKQYDDGFDYIEKEKIVEVFKPPLQVESIEKYKWPLPFSFDVGASLILYLTAPDQAWNMFGIQIFDTDGDNINIYDSDLEVLMLYLDFRADLNKVIVSSYDQGWKNTVSVNPLPVSTGHSYRIRIEVHAQSLRAVFDNNIIREIPHLVPPKSAAAMYIFCRSPSLLYIHNITMNGDV